MFAIILDQFTDAEFVDRDFIVVEGKPLPTMDAKWER